MEILHLVDGDRPMAAIKIPVAALVLLCGFIITRLDRNEDSGNNLFMKRFYRRRSKRRLTGSRAL